MKTHELAKPSVLLLETLAEPAHDLLAQAIDIELVTAFDFDLSPLQKENILAIITRGKGQVSQSVIDQFPNLKMVARAGVGLNNVDVEYASGKGIMVLNNPGANAQTVAEHNMALMLMLQRNVFMAIREVKSDNWNYRNQYQGDELFGKTLGIVGFGNIGKKVAEMAKAFGMKVIYTGRPKDEKELAFRTFSELAQEADILSLHVPLTAETEKMVNADILKRMKKNALIVNTARGALIDEEALFSALQQGRIGGYAADVMRTQPPEKNDKLLALPNVLITPHLASLSARTYNKMCFDSASNVLALLRGQKPLDGCIFNESKLNNNKP
ncbi:hydroxyacid dehydrogenase [Marinilongibacter aquaticus]|uniref:2-hydroxyacid dehydrogenase n=1 Tax=Marinilongibacter aquaticus TaxID=2975157 RepID=UPI0021BD4820|nr:hydroxyacid dehydrogenase [Marinilongibacter aquaticus]UBM57527.1 hydroxyacid dehydrogenase [Marinilongibacter aquaticus]